MNIEFDTQYTAERLVSLALPNENTQNDFILEKISQTERALYHLKTMAENEYNEECFRDFIKVLKNICIYDYLED